MADAGPKPDHGKKENPKRPVDSREMQTLDESSQAAAELTTRRIGQFEVLEVLGEGAFGAVYHAKDTVLEREVAIKVPHASRITTQEMRQRFLREARSAAGLRHPHICPVFEVGEDNDTPYIVMAFIKGQELSAVLKRRGHLKDRQAAVMVRRLALALEFAHQQGIVHRDLKPDNIMIDRERKEPVIMDFGLARRDSGKESQLTQEGQLMGTPVCMPPEQARGDIAQVGPASDIYSLGIILYELLCGCRPHEGSLAEVLSKVLTADAAPPSSQREDISPQLEAICMKAIAREVDDRHASMLEFADDLGEFLKSDGSTSTSPVQQVKGEQSAGHSVETAAHTETVLVPAAEQTASVESKRRPASELWGRNRIKICVAAAAVLLLVLALAGPWSGNGGTQNTGPSGMDRGGSNSVLVREFQGNSERLTGVAFSPDGRWIAARTEKGTVFVWHREESRHRLETTYKKKGSIQKGSVRRLQFSPDSRILMVTLPGRIFNISIPDGEQQVAVDFKVARGTRAVRSQSGTIFTSRGFPDNFMVSKWDQSGLTLNLGIPYQNRIAIHWGVLPESEVFLAVQKNTGGLHIWDFRGKLTSQRSPLLTEDEDLTLPGRHDSPPTCLTWSHDERIAATAAADGSVILWDIPSRRELRRLERHPSTVHSLALSHDGHFLLTGCGQISQSTEADTEGLSDEYSIRLWDVATGKLLTIVGSHRDTVTGLAFGSDPIEAVSCSADNTVCLWKLPITDSLPEINSATDASWKAMSPEDWESSRIVEGAFIPDEAAWVTQHGTVRCDSILESIIVSPQSYADFELELQVQIPAGKVLGVVVRGSAEAGKMVLVPLLTAETRSSLDKVMRPKWEKDGTVALIEATAAATRPAPYWNTLRIRCVADRISATLNSVALDDELAGAHVFREPLSAGQIGLISPAGTAKDVVVRRIKTRTLD